MCSIQAMIGIKVATSQEKRMNIVGSRRETKGQGAFIRYLEDILLSKHDAPTVLK